MRHMIASMLGMTFEFKISENRCYIKTDNEMTRAAFKRLLSTKSLKEPESHGKWDLYELENATEQEVYDTLKDNLSKAGMSIVKEEIING